MATSSTNNESVSLRNQFPFSTTLGGVAQYPAIYQNNIYPTFHWPVRHVLSRACQRKRQEIKVRSRTFGSRCNSNRDRKHRVLHLITRKCHCHNLSTCQSTWHQLSVRSNRYLRDRHPTRNHHGAPQKNV